MKKIFGKFGRSKSSKGGATPESPKLGAAAGHAGSELGYEIREKDLPKLHRSAWTGDLAKVKQLVKKDPNTFDKENRTALHLACVAGHSQVVKELLEWGAKTNLGDSDCKTPLLKAVECNKEESVNLLLEHRASVDAVDRDGDSSLHIAVRHGYTNIVKILLHNGAEIDKKNKEGYAPLHLSCKGKKAEITRTLLAENAHVDVSDVNGRTPLMHACYEGSITPVQLLLQHNANTMIKDIKGFAAEDIAMMTAQHGCVQLIHDHNMKLRRSGGGGSVNTTPRSSLPPSASATPRDNTVTSEFGLPQQQNSDEESGDETVSKISTGGDFERSWGDDTDISLSTDIKKGKDKDDSDIDGGFLDEEEADVPKINLATALKKLPQTDNTNDDGGEVIPSEHNVEPVAVKTEGSHISPKADVGKRDSNKSIQSHTSIEDNWSDDEESHTARTPRVVTFKEGNEISQTIEITGDEADTDEEEYVRPKKAKIDNRVNKPANQQGYTPTALVDFQGSSLSPEKQKEDTGEEGKGAIIEELGLNEMSDLSDPESPSEVSDLPDGGTNVKVTIPVPPDAAGMASDEDEDEDMHTDQLAPGPGILKNWKQHSQEQTQRNQQLIEQRKEHKEQMDDPKSEQVSEWDSDVEDALDPEKSEERAESPTEFVETEDLSMLPQLHHQYIDSESEDEIQGKSHQVLKVSHDGTLMGVGDSPIVIHDHHNISVESPQEEEEGSGASGRRSTSVPVGGEVVEMEEVEDEVKEENSEENKLHSKAVFSIGNVEEEDEETDLEVARVLALEQESAGTSQGFDAGQPISQAQRTPSQDTLAILHTEEDESSHWDSSADVVTPRNYQVINNATNQTIAEFMQQDHDEEEEADFVQEVPLETVDAAIQEAATGSFDVMSTGTQDSGQSGTTGSGPRTVLENTAVQNTINKNDDHNKKDEESDSDWDSDADALPSESGNNPPVIGISGYTELPPPPPVPSREADRALSDEDDDEETESVSEWELERQKQKELKQKLEEEEEERKEAEVARQREWEEEEQRRQEKLRKEAEEEEILRQQEEEEALIRQEEEEQQRIEEERRLEKIRRAKLEKEQEEARRQAELEQEEVRRQAQLKQEEARRQAELEQEEARRQAQKVQEEARRQAQLEQEEEQKRKQMEEEEKLRFSAEQQVPLYRPSLQSEDAEKRRLAMMQKQDQQVNSLDKMFDISSTSNKLNTSNGGGTSLKKELKTVNFLRVSNFIKDEKQSPGDPNKSLKVTSPPSSTSSFGDFEEKHATSFDSGSHKLLDVQSSLVPSSVKSLNSQSQIEDVIKPKTVSRDEMKPSVNMSQYSSRPADSKPETGVEGGNESHHQSRGTTPPISQSLPGPYSRSSPLINTSPATAMSLQSDGMSLDDDDSDLEPERRGRTPFLRERFLREPPDEPQRPVEREVIREYVPVFREYVASPEPETEMGTYLKTLPTFNYAPYKSMDVPDDDVLSFTSTENGESTAYAANLPYGKDVLANMNLSDPGTVLKLQEHLRDQRKLLDQERNHRTTIESKHKSLMKEKNDLQKKIDALNYTRQTLEQSKLDLEQKIRNLEYKFTEELEMRKNAETLLNKTKEQLTRKEDQYTGEMEAKQKLELQIRNLQMEIRSANNVVKQLEDEKDSLTRQYQHEKSARQLQEQLNEDQQKLQQQLHDEQIRSATQKSNAENRYEEADEERKHTHDNLDKTRAELIAIRRELDRQRTGFKEENALLSTENEELQRKIEEFKNEIKLNEDALAHATVQYNLQLSNSRTEVGVLNGVVDRERASREKLEAELESVRNRLQAATSEMDKYVQARNDLERRYQDEKEDWIRKIDTKDKEVSSMKENTQGLLHRLHATETKLNSIENELHISNTTLLERSNMLQQAQKDVQFYKSAQDNYDQNYKVEKELNVKLQTKVETLQERNTGLQHQNLNLKQQLETTQQTLADKAGENTHEKFTTMLATLKTEHDKSQLALEERNSSLSETVSRLREELRTSEGRRNQIEQELSRLNREYNDLIRKLSVSEASLDIANKAKESLEQERGQLKLEVDKLHQKYEMAHEKSIESQARIAEMVDRLERSEQNNMFNNQQLLNTSANMEAFSRSKEELEESFQKLQVDNVRLQAELTHEKQRAEMLHKDLQDSQRVRSSLEDLCSNLKSSKAQLEDKLGEESATRTIISQEAESHKDMWEQEVISRSKLGLRLSQYEKQKQEALSQLEEERRKCRKALELKKVADTKLEGEQEKNMQLQKENVSLKAYLKVAKKRLKVVNKSDTRISTLHTDFDMERVAMEGTLTTVRKQMDDLQKQLQDEVDEKSHLQTRNLQLQNELGSLKRLEKNLQKLERNKQKLEQEYQNYKSRVENGFIDREELDQVRKEMEAHYRQELNRKLSEVNGYLEEQARSREKLDTSRDDTEHRLKDTNKKLQDENTSLRIKYEQIVAQKDSKEMEAKRFRDLYESEMQWRMRLSEQLMRSSDRAMNYKTKLVAERQKTRIQNNMGNMTFSGTLNGHLLDSTRFSSTGEDILSNRLKAELDRSIAKHLEAAPHDNIKPLVRSSDDPLVSSTFAKSNADYLDLLKRKYCV